MTDSSVLYGFDASFGLLPGSVCGVDEAGRGPLCGPVFTAAVILPEGPQIEGLNDSKKLTPQKREKLYGEIITRAVAWSVDFADVEEIDTFNILNATLRSMRRSVDSLAIKPGLILIDGNCKRGFENENAMTVVKGDARSAAIAAASILAKVSRDRFMEYVDRLIPEYSIASHKGYPTAKHYEALKKFGMTPYHRKSFLKNLGEK